MKTYVAFLRGINSGKNPSVKMADLRKVFEDLGFENVKTVQASGNVIFDTEFNSKTVASKLEQDLSKGLGFKSDVCLLTKEEIKDLLKLDPFKDISLNKKIKLNITFVQQSPKLNVQLPFQNKDKGFTVLHTFNNVVFSIVDISQGSTLDIMSFFDKELGKNITTRRWGTVEKVWKKMEG